MLRDQASRNGILLCGAASSNEIFPALIPTEFSKPFLIPFQKVKKVKVLWSRDYWSTKIPPDMPAYCIGKSRKTTVLPRFNGGNAKVAMVAQQSCLTKTYGGSLALWFYDVFLDFQSDNYLLLWWVEFEFDLSKLKLFTTQFSDIDTWTLK